MLGRQIIWESYLGEWFQRQIKCRRNVRAIFLTFRKLNPLQTAQIYLRLSLPKGHQSLTFILRLEICVLLLVPLLLMITGDYGVT
jgi:hypothetical protein